MCSSDLYIPPSNFLVQPVVGTLSYKPLFIPDPTEVSGILEITIDDLLDPRFISEKEVRVSSGHNIQTPVYTFSGEIVWGATAMMLSELKTVLFEMGL